MKSQMRKQYLSKRSKLSDLEVNKKSKIIIDKLETIIKQSNYHNILIYMDFNQEVQTSLLLNKGYNIYVTKSLPNNLLKINKYEEDKLIKHPYGYYEVNSEEYINPTIIDLIVVPGVAFDTKGNRLGYGKGYYDRFIAANPSIPKIALSFDLQISDHIPTDEYDQRMNMLITESNIYILKDC